MIRQAACSALFLATAFAIEAEAQWQCEYTPILANDAAASDAFGEDVAISGDVALVGAGDEEEGVIGAGSAYVFRRVAGIWTQEQKLTRPTPASYYHFGRSVALDGNVAVCGVPDDDDFAEHAGSVDVFRYNGTSWVHEQRLAASDTAGGDRFGWSVDVQGSVLVVGAKFDDDVQSNSGSAYVFRHNGTSWVQEQKLTAFDAAQNAQFGDAIALNANVIVVGAWQDDDAGFFTGSAYVFRYNGVSFLSEQKLNASDQDQFHWFGRSVDVDGNLIVCGAYEADVGAFTSGAAYLFRHAAGVWTEEAKLAASDTNNSIDNFGWSSAVSGDVVVVGSRRDQAPLPESGSVYVYKHILGGVWGEADKVTAPAGLNGDQMGYSIALDGDSVVAGAFLADTPAGLDAGAVYAFRVVGSCTNGLSFCFCTASNAPCANAGGAGEGCTNSTGSGALMTATGSSSIAAANLVFTSVHLPDGAGLYFQGTQVVNGGAGTPFGDGLFCAGGELVRLKVVFSAGGMSRYPTGAQAPIATEGLVFSGDTRSYQLWYRDISGPCSNLFNTSNAIRITWAP